MGDSGSSPVFCFSCDGEPLPLFPRAVLCRPPTRTEMGSMNLEIGDIDMLVVCLAQDPADVLVALTSESIRLGGGGVDMSSVRRMPRRTRCC